MSTCAGPVLLRNPPLLEAHVMTRLRERLSGAGLGLGLGLVLLLI